MTGFPNWNKTEYARFIKAFRKLELGDIEGIALEVETKSFDEVSAYMEVFLQRFRELKERDLVIMKFEKKTFEQKNLETIRDFDRNQSYFCMV